MSIVKLTENLENFKWTEYNKIGDDTDIDPNKGGVHGSTKDKLFPHQTEHSIHDDGIGSGTYPNDNPQSYTVRGDIVTGNKSFYRPAESALVNMESEFGPLNTQPPDRGPYGVTDYMDGTQQGQGFIPPGGPPLGFTVDMGVSEYAIGDPLNYTLTPLSHTIAGMNSSLEYGVVEEETLDISPRAEGAYGALVNPPISSYTSTHSPTDPFFPSYAQTHPTDIFHTYDGIEGTKLYDTFNSPFSVPFKHLSLNTSPFLNQGQTSGWKLGSVHIGTDDIAGVLGGGVNYYGDLKSLAGRSSIYMDENGDYRVPTIEATTVPPGITEQYPSNILDFTVDQITHNIPQITLSGPFGDEDYQSTLQLTPISADAHGSNTVPLENYASQYSPDDAFWPNYAEPWPDKIFHELSPEGTKLYDHFGSPFSVPFNHLNLNLNPFLNQITLDMFGNMSYITFEGWKQGSIHIPSDQTSPATTWEDMTFPEANKTTEVYQHHFLTSPFTPITVGTDLFDETGATTPWKDGSIHIPSDVTEAAAIGGQALQFANLDAFSPLGTPFPSIYQNPENMKYTRPSDFDDISENPQRTFNVQGAYPNNIFSYSIGDQFGYSYSERYITDSLPIQSTNLFPPLYEDFTLSDELSGEFAGTALSAIFYQAQADNPNWPYKGVGLGDNLRLLPQQLPDTYQPYVIKDVGERTIVGRDNIVLASLAAAEDIERINQWGASPIGKNWIRNQTFLQDLNPRPETRDFSMLGIQASLLPFVHTQRHSTTFTGEGEDSYGNYWKNYGVLGKPEAFFLDASTVETWGYGTRVKDGFGKIGEDIEDVDGDFGASTEHHYSRLTRLTNKFIIPTPDTDLKPWDKFKNYIGGMSRFGGTPATPTQYVFSQKGPFAESRKETLSDGLPLPGSGWWGEKNKYGLFALSKLVDFQVGIDPYGFVQIGPVAAQFWGTHYNEYAPTRVWDEDGAPKPLELGTKNYKYQNVFKGNWYSDRVVKSSSDTSAGSPDLIHKRYKTKSYDQLGGKYIPSDSPIPGEGASASDEPIAPTNPNVGREGGDLDLEAGLKYDAAVKDYGTKLEVYEQDKSDIKAQNEIIEKYKATLMAYGQVSTNIGHPGKQQGLKRILDPNAAAGAGLGVIKTNTGDDKYKYKSIATDKINIHPYGKDLPEDVSDFVKFKFKDIVNTKFLIFRALLSGISDSITPEWTGTRYIGRPDQVYVYSGTERKVSFNFDIYPKTKQEFPVLLEKLNYLIGLCYPSFTPDNRMIAPFIELTIGDMFVDTPGFLDSLSVSVEDNSTWEIEDGLQFPKYIKCDCSFTYVGKYMPSTLGKHYELGWLDDKGWSLDKDGTGTKGTFTSEENVVDKPNRIEPMAKLFSGLG